MTVAAMAVSDYRETMARNLQTARAPDRDWPPENAPIRVVVADDHDQVRRSLRLLLEGEGDVSVVAEASDLFTAMRHVDDHLPHVLVLDLQMPNGSSIDLIRRLRAQSPMTRVVITSMEDSPAFAQHALEAGAFGYVLKDDATRELGTAVRHAAAAERYVSPAIAARLKGFSDAIAHDGLTEREAEVLRLIALGLTSAEMAERLHLSQRTIEAHRHRLHRKLGLEKRSQLVRYALRHHLVRGETD